MLQSYINLHSFALKLIKLYFTILAIDLQASFFFFLSSLLSPFSNPEEYTAFSFPEILVFPILEDCPSLCIFFMALEHLKRVRLLPCEISLSLYLPVCSWSKLGHAFRQEYLNMMLRFILAALVIVPSIAKTLVPSLDLTSTWEKHTTCHFLS